MHEFNALHHAATYCNILQTLACTTVVLVGTKKLSCVAVCCSVLQCVTIGCSVAHYVTLCANPIRGKYMIHVIICEHRNCEHKCVYAHSKKTYMKKMNACAHSCTGGLCVYIKRCIHAHTLALVVYVFTRV